MLTSEAAIELRKGAGDPIIYNRTLRKEVGRGELDYERGTILMVDDEAELRQVLEEYLSARGYTVLPAENATAARALCGKHAIDLALLDIRLPGEDGLSLARHLRERYRMGIVMLTGAGTVVDRIVGLEMGADDYLPKPFELRELLARIRAVLRRAQGREPSPPKRNKRTLYRFAGWELDMHTRCLRSPEGAPVALTRGELSLLAAFLCAPGRVLSRNELLDLSRVHDNEVFDRSLDVQILRLRRKIEANPGDPTLIKTERGVGYRFATKVEVL